MKTIFACLVLMTGLAMRAQIPTIGSFTPTSGPVGSSVTLSGNNFSPTAANNIVYFGKVQANVSAATATSLTVAVPAGTTFDPISVTANGLTAYSARPFAVTFANGVGANFGSNALALPQSLVNAHRHCVADLDNDGRLDLAVAANTNRLSLFRNMGGPAEYVLSAGPTYLTNNTIDHIIAADFTGDGKLDLALAFRTVSGVYIYQNSSTVGNLSFEAPVFYATASDNTFHLGAADIDGNGKTDLVIAYASSGRAFTTALNTGNSGTVSFGPPIHVSFGANVSNFNKVYLSDMDGDNKTDVVVLSTYFPAIYFYRNTSGPGTASFAARVSVPVLRPGVITDPSFHELQLGDMDGDNKADMAYVSRDSAFVSLYRNISTVGNIAFATKVNVPTPMPPHQLVMQDFDGDAKADLASWSPFDSVAVFKNNSTPGTLALAAPRYFLGKYGLAFALGAADMDGDGKADLLLSGTNIGNTNSTLILRNQVNGPVINSFTPVTAGKDTVVIIRGARFANATAVYFGDSAATAFTVLSDSVIRATVGGGASGKITVTAATGIDKRGGFTFTQPIPAVFAVVPPLGPVGATVSIKGKNFSASPAANTVYFGAAPATVTAASDTLLTVTVPPGSDYQPVSVTNGNNLTAYSPTPFNITFEGGQNAFVNANIADTAVSNITFSDPWRLAFADLDKDGRTDIVTSVYLNTQRLSVFRNTGSNGNLAFAARSDFSTYFGSFIGSSGNPIEVAVADIDGDGRTDMLASNGTSDSMSVLRNTSTGPGNIAFAPKADFQTARIPQQIAIADLDADGKPDVMVNNYLDQTFGSSVNRGGFSIFKNVSVPGSIAFGPRQDYLVFITGGSHTPMIRDVDGDGKPDIVTLRPGTPGRILFYRNISTVGTIAFADSVAFVPGHSIGNYFMADMDMDGKPDLGALNFINRQLILYRNSGTPGNMQWALQRDYLLPRRVLSFDVADLSGDGKNDLVFYTDSANTFVVYKNIGSPNNLQLAPSVNFNRGFGFGVLKTADLSGDGKPELVVTNTNNYRVNVFRNRIDAPVGAALCPGGDSTTLLAGGTAATYQWQVNTGGGFANIADNGNYTGTASAALTIRGIPLAWLGYQYRCVTNLFTSTVFTLNIENRWLGTVDGNWENPANWSCGRLPDSNTDVVINGGPVAINTNVTIRSLRLSPLASLTVAAGYTLTVLR
jgi:large repetitive protein